MAKTRDIAFHLDPARATALWDQLARRVAAHLSKKYRIDVRKACAVLEEEVFSDWSARISESAYQVSLYRFEGIRSPALFLVEAGSGEIICDLLLGGRPHRLASDDLKFIRTSHAMISSRVEARFIEMIAAQLEDELAAFGAGKFRYYSSEGDIRLYNQIADSEICVSIRFDFDVSDTQTLNINLVLPKAACERLYASKKRVDEYGASRLLVSYQHLANLDVDVSATLAELNMTLKDLVALAPGDLLAIDNESAVLRVEGSPFRRGRLLIGEDGRWVFKPS